MVEKVISGDSEDRSSEEEFEVIETDGSGNPVQGSQDNSADDDDSRLSAEEEEESTPEPGQPPRKRETHQQRRERHRRARERDQREMNFLRNEVVRLGQAHERLQTVIGQNRVEDLDSRLSEELARAEQAERIEAAAIKANNGEDAVKARRIREEALSRAQAIHREKQSVQAPATDAAQPNGQGAPPPYLNHVREFAKDKPWFNFNRADPDNAVVLALDTQVAGEGFSPNTAEYWAELDRRVRERLPHKFGSNSGSRQDDADDEDEPTQRRARGGPPVGAGRTHVPETTRTQVYISPERKQAMIDAGVWDDPVLRQRYVKRYAEWDRDNKPARR